MDTQDTNTQPQPDASSPVAAGPSAAELQAQLEEYKKQSEGRLRDLQQERARRQELEARLSSPAPSAAKPDVTEDELAKVLHPYIAPVAKQAAEAQAELETLRVEKAKTYLSEKTGKSWNVIESDHEFQDKMHQIVRKYGVTGNTYERTQRAYELFELENLRTKEVERVRAAQTASAASLPSGTGKPTSSTNAKKYTGEEFNRLPASEFGNMSDKGDFRKLPDGTFEYTPR
jgi:hypothetical protein